MTRAHRASATLTALVAVALLAAHTVHSQVLQVAPDAPAVVFEGARLITGDGTTVIEDSAFLVERGRFSAVGRRGQLQLPAGAAHVSLAGKTVIPALVDGHSHIGYQKSVSTSVKNYSRGNILDHMHRFAFYGIAASQAMGSDFGDMPYELSRETIAGQYPDAARFLTSGRGLAPLSEITADNMRHAAFVVSTEEGARANVRELASRGVTIMKTWVRAEPKMSPALFATLIEEAHRHNARVAVHATEPADAKELLEAGIDVFAHMLDDVDEELVTLFKSHPHTSVLPSLPAPRLAAGYAPWLNPLDPLLAITQRPEHLTLFRTRVANAADAERTRATEAWAKQSKGLLRLKQAGVTIGLGTDGGGQNGGYVGWTAHAELENLVTAGLTPMEALTAATRNTASILRLDDLGMVAVGKSADFDVLDGNPLENITNTRRINSVYLRGHRVDRERLAAIWQSGRYVE